MSITRRNWNVNAKTMKLALMKYFRFERGYLCATEFMEMDVAAHTGANLIEAEVKVSKQDLMREGRKRKHETIAHGNIPRYRAIPNFFYMAVPGYLLEAAEKWVSETNDKYGIIHVDEYIVPSWRGCSVSIKKRAVKLHDRDDMKWRWKVALRTCSENITMMERLIKADNETKIVVTVPSEKGG